MGAKIVRILLILLAIFIMAYYLPSFYQKSVEKRPYKTMIYFSEVTHDFIIAKESGDTLNRQAEMHYYDAKGNEIPEKEYMKLLPFNNTRKLKLMGEMPDSLNGIELNNKILKSVRRSILIAEPFYSLALNPLFESQPERIGVQLPDDVFRINKHGIEFLNCESNRIEQEKSKKFNQPLIEKGFSFPAKGIYGIPSTIKLKDDGYFIVDNSNRLFHLKMIKGEPFCKEIKFNGTIKNIKCHSSGDLFCHIFDDNNQIYVLTREYELHKIPVENPNGRFFVTSNYFYNTYKVNDKDKSTLYVLSPEYKLIAKHTETIDHYSHSKEAEIERSIFPFKIMRTPGLAHFIPIPNPVKDFYILNLICAGIFIIIKLIRRRKIWLHVNVADFTIILLTGIYGFIGVWIFPNRK